MNQTARNLGAQKKYLQPKTCKYDGGIKLNTMAIYAL